jgi:hypothetical protein
MAGHIREQDGNDKAGRGKEKDEGKAKGLKRERRNLDPRAAGSFGAREEKKSGENAARALRAVSNR